MSSQSHTVGMRVVRSGTWLYDSSIPRPVDIVALDFDFWFSIGEADGTLELGEAAQPLGPDACLYYVRFQRAGDQATPTWVDSGGYISLTEAESFAQAKSPSPITWA